MQPADHPGALGDKVVVAVGQQAQHRAVIDRRDRPQPGMTQHHRGRTGVVRVGPVGPAGVEEPNPGRQRRRHVEHPLAGGDELLSQQRAETASRLDRPGSWRERLSEPQQPVGLAAVGVDAGAVPGCRSVARGPKGMDTASFRRAVAAR